MKNMILIRYMRHIFRAVKNMFRKVFYVFLKLPYKILYGNSIVLFESHYEFDGNSGALYKYLRARKNYNSYIFVWIVDGFKDGSYKNTRHDLVFSFNNCSFLKKFLINNAKLAFYDDVPIRAGLSGAKTIYLTHGQLGLKDVKGKIVVPDWVDNVLCISDYYKPLFCNQISCSQEKIFICGMPRNDILFQHKVDFLDYFDGNNYKKIILWLPTFRKRSSDDRNDSIRDFPFGIPLIYTREQFELVNDFLKEKNMLLVLKMHPVQDLTIIRDINLSNIIFISHKSLIEKHIGTNALYPHSDAMISDYSSAATDFMLLDKPLAYIVEDREDYKLNLPKEIYDKCTPGTKIKTINELLHFLEMVYMEKDKFKKQRRALVNLVHKYQDGNNCKRIVDKFNV